MTKIMISEDCGNYPKNLFVQEMTIMFAIGNVAAFVASGKARTMTSTEINISSGAIVD